MNRMEENLEVLRDKFFLKPDGSNAANLVELVRAALDSLIKNQGDGSIYPTFDRKARSEVSEKASVPNHLSTDPHQILNLLPHHLQGSVRASSPFMIKNIIPLPSFIHLATNLAVAVLMPNGVTGEDAGAILESEIACTSSISKLAGLDPKESGGVFTFGGTGTNMYGFKMGLYKSDPEHGKKGVSPDNVVIGAKPSHYSHQTAANWLGVGQDNYLQVSSNHDQTTRLNELERVCAKAIESGKRIACIEALGGTTSNMAIDDFEAICHIRDHLVQKYDLDYVPHIHADTVLGWAYLNLCHMILKRMNSDSVQ